MTSEILRYLSELKYLLCLEKSQKFLCFKIGLGFPAAGGRGESLVNFMNYVVYDLIIFFLACECHIYYENMQIYTHK